MELLRVGVGVLKEGVRKGLKVGVPNPPPPAVRGEGSPFFPLLEGIRRSMMRGMWRWVGAIAKMGQELGRKRAFAVAAV